MEWTTERNDKLWSDNNMNSTNVPHQCIHYLYTVRAYTFSHQLRIHFPFWCPLILFPFSFRLRALAISVGTSIESKYKLGKEQEHRSIEQRTPKTLWHCDIHVLAEKLCVQRSNHYAIEENEWFSISIHPTDTKAFECFFVFFFYSFIYYMRLAATSNGFVFNFSLFFSSAPFAVVRWLLWQDWICDHHTRIPVFALSVVPFFFFASLHYFPSSDCAQSWI